MGENLIKLSDAVVYVPYKLSTFRRMASEGAIPCTKIGSRYFVDVEEIKEFVKSITMKKEGNHAERSKSNQQSFK